MHHYRSTENCTDTHDRKVCEVCTIQTASLLLAKAVPLLLPCATTALLPLLLISMGLLRLLLVELALLLRLAAMSSTLLLLLQHLAMQSLPSLRQAHSATCSSGSSASTTAALVAAALFGLDQSSTL